MLNIDKRAQHSFLIRRGFRTNRRNADKDGRYIEDLQNRSFYMPQILLRSDENIADALFGELNEDNLTDEQLAVVTKKRVSLVRQWTKRYFKLFVPITDEKTEIVLKLFNT